MIKYIILCLVVFAIVFWMAYQTMQPTLTAVNKRNAEINRQIQEVSNGE